MSNQNNYKYRPYFKKIDRSFFEWGLIIPKEYESDFLYGESIDAGSSRSMDVIFNSKKYKVKLYHVNRKNASNVYQLRWDMNTPLFKILRETFVHSYVILKSQKEQHDTTSGKKKKFRTKLTAGQQEVSSLRPISPTEILIEPFIKIDSEWNTLFKRLANSNVFETLFEKNKDYLIERSTEWMNVNNFQPHINQVSVIYYLVNTRKKLLYIGKANKLGDRVVPGRAHQGMPGDWDKFKYDIIRPEYSHLLERIEDHTIRTVATLLRNTNSNISSLEIGEYKLTNKNWKKL